MPSRALVIAFRYKLLLLLPFLVAIPAAIAFVFLTGSTKYQTHAQVTVSRPLVIEGVVATRWNPFISPAQNQAGFVREALATNEFAQRVADAASEGYSREITRAEVQQGSWAAEAGTGLLRIGFTGADAEVATRVSNAIVQEYAEREPEVVLEELAAGQEYFAAEIESVRSDLRDLRTQLANRIAELPPDADPRFDPTAAALENDITGLESQEGQLTSRLATIEQLMAQAERGDSPTFRLADEAEAPTAPLARTKVSMIGPPALAALLALAISAGLFAFLFHTDSTLRSLDDFAMLPGVSPLGMVPEVASNSGAISNIKQFTRNLTSGGRDQPASGG